MIKSAGGPRPVAGTLLDTLSGPAAVELAELGTRRAFAAGSVLLRQGDLSAHVYLLLGGVAKVTATTPEGGFALLAIRVAGDLVGELAGLDGQPRSATVTAAGTVAARVITRSVFNDFLNRHADVGVALSRSVAGKLRWATRRRIGVPLTQPELAALVGAAEPTVHQALAMFRRSGVIGTGYRSTTVLDLPALRAVAAQRGDRSTGNHTGTG